MRVISAVPSLTELLFDLGLDIEVVGITKFCIHPHEWFRSKQRIGGTKNLNIEKILALNPNIIIANKEENTKEQIEELSQHFNVYLSDINNLDEAIQMIKDIGKLVNKENGSLDIVDKILSEKARFNLQQVQHKTAYAIWKSPFMFAGKGTFIDDMMIQAGFINLLSETRYPSLNIDELIELNPEIILLSSEPFPFKQHHADELKLHLPQSKVVLVDGEMFSWYGSRLIKSFSYFNELKNEILL